MLLDNKHDCTVSLKTIGTQTIETECHTQIGNQESYEEIIMDALKNMVLYHTENNIHTIEIRLIDRKQYISKILKEGTHAA